MIAPALFLNSKIYAERARNILPMLSAEDES
jgi:hypothetical protein